MGKRFREISRNGRCDLSSLNQNKYMSLRLKYSTTMSFACQRDSYQTQLSSEVVSCSPVQLITRQGQKQTITGHEVVCQDSVLFPEGGGQNSDQGQLNGWPVLQVSRKGLQAVHFVADSPGFSVGEVVQQEVDWTRRFDHMQQHTGQHLISALFESQLEINTTSWWMAENNGDKVGVSYIELDQPNITKEQLQQIEDQCNQAIREHLDVRVHVYEDAHDPALTVAIKLLSVDKGKKSKSLLNFVVGNRDLFVCIAVGDETQGPCQLAIVGQEDIVQDLGPRLIKILGGKGGGKGHRINGRIPSFKSWPNVVKEVEAYFSD
ncbi:hypothetical protein TCAL_07673 [Tigriopus californicus]|uniref:Threonyl/alanyl tRNA synthetase SAD domain-containing protein n=1 Tax=Tigriopus californicus TaxID=6832 RepID=A0A553NS42_TIGCA|nr:hypothetical protein TCAL_07673 [Tigriopus californicus]